ncbi:MAG: peptidylprolyl isomerase [Alphaproteobacteria bacterium]
MQEKITKIAKIFCFFCCFIVCAHTCEKKVLPNNTQIAIVVNRDVITWRDIYYRSWLILLTSGLLQPGEIPKENVIKTVFESVLNSLIDESLQLQIAKEQRLIVPKEEIDAAFNEIAQNNGISLGKMQEMLRSHHPELITTLQMRLKAQIVWGRLIRGIAPIKISNKDIEKEKKRFEENQKKDQYELFELTLFVPHPSKKQFTKEKIVSLYNQLQKGAQFQALAQQLSESVSSIKGGYLGWYTESQIDPYSVSFIKQLEVGSFSRPIDRGNNFIIYLLKDIKRSGKAAHSDISVNVQHVVIPMSQHINESAYRSLEYSIDFIGQAVGIKDFKERTFKSGYSSSSKTLPLNFFPQHLWKPIREQKMIGRTLPPFKTESEIIIMMIGGCYMPIYKIPTEKEIEEILLQKKFVNISQGKMKELQSMAYIEKRL